MATIFVTDGQLRSALAAVRALGRSGHRVLCGESSRAATSFMSKYVCDSVQYPPPGERPHDFIGFLEEYLSNNNVDVLLPIGHESTRIINKYKKRLLQYTSVPVPGGDKFDHLVRKDTAMKLAEELEIPHPETIHPRTLSEASTLVSKLDFPVVIKPIDQSGSRGLQFADSMSEFERKYSRVSEAYLRPIVQEKLPSNGDGLGAAFLLWDGEVKAHFGYRRLREYPPGGGPSTLRESIEDRRILEQGRALLEEVNWEGVAMVEFKNDPRTDTPNLIEVNPRFWGSLHLPLYSGIDFPTMLVDCALGNDVRPNLNYSIGVQSRFLLPGDILYLLGERNTGAVRAFFSYNGEKFDIIDGDDPMPVFGRLGAMIWHSMDPSMWREVVFRS